ncbi:MAG: CBS domain-containing protein [Polyangiaceae bacterium]
MGTRVEEVMTPDPLTLGPSALVRDAYAMMKEKGFRHVPIVEGDVLKGIISLTDIGKLGARIPEVLQMVIGDVMTTTLLTVGPGESVDVAAAKMASRKINCLPIVENDKLVGIVTTYDLLDALARRLRGDE